jgi:rare lipoprotein A
MKRLKPTRGLGLSQGAHHGVTTLSLLGWVLAGCATSASGRRVRTDEPTAARLSQVSQQRPPRDRAHEENGDVRGARDRGESALVESGPANTSSLDAQYKNRRAVLILYGDSSYYHDSLAGNPTASGEPYDPRLFTGAHRTLPLGTIVRIIRVDTKRFVTIRINDRGPFGRRKRIVDLSRAAAEQLAMIRAGVTRVRVEVLQYGRRRR